MADSVPMVAIVDSNASPDKSHMAENESAGDDVGYLISCMALVSVALIKGDRTV